MFSEGRFYLSLNRTANTKLTNICKGEKHYRPFARDGINKVKHLREYAVFQMILKR